MTAEQIHERLAKKLGEAVLPYQAPAAGDPFIIVKAEALPQAARVLRDDAELAFDLLRLVSGVDWKDRISAVYHLYSTRRNHEVTIRVDLNRENPRVESVTDVWPAADWLERETFDLMGIVFEGHPNPTRILLPDDWPGHPLRKDYVAPTEDHGISNLQ